MRKKDLNPYHAPSILLINRAVVLDGNNNILLIKRSKKDTWMPGKWELPGGKIEANQDITKALEAEVMQETGLSVVPVDKLAYYTSEVLTTGKYSGYTYVLIAGIVRCVGDTSVELSNEHDDFAWITYEDLRHYDVVVETKTILKVLKKHISDN